MFKITKEDLNYNTAFKGNIGKWALLLDNGTYLIRKTKKEIESYIDYCKYKNIIIDRQNKITRCETQIKKETLKGNIFIVQDLKDTVQKLQNEIRITENKINGGL